MLANNQGLDPQISQFMSQAYSFAKVLSDNEIIPSLNIFDDWDQGLPSGPLNSVNPLNQRLNSQTDFENAMPERASHPKHQGPLVQKKHEGMFKQIEEEIDKDLVPIEEAIEPINKPFEGAEKSVADFFRPVEDTLVDDADAITETLYPDAGDYVYYRRNWYEYLGYFRWVLNFLWVGIPWVFTSQMLILANFVFNIWLNQWWADGNFFLLFNTFFIIVETWGSYPLIFEIPWWIKHTRLIRVLVTGLSVMYTSVYFIALFVWVYQLWLEPEAEYEQYDFVSVMENMYLIYSLIFHLHILPVNFMILWKELSLEFFSMLDTDSNDGLDAEDVADTANPVSWWDQTTL